MITRAERLELFRFFARQRDCSLCKDWPRAERAARRQEVLNFPARICVRCHFAFWSGICVTTNSPEESEAWKQAVREERKKPPNSRRHGQEILDELRAKAAAKH